MLLTRELADDLQRFRLGTMRRFVEAAHTLLPEADGKPVGSGFASYLGDGSPLTQTYGLGYMGAEFDLDELDAFYAHRAGNWELIVTPFTSSDLVRSALLRGYRFDHFETVLVRTAEPTNTELPPGVTLEEASASLEEWMRAAAAGWSGAEQMPGEVDQLARLMACDRSVRRYLARVDGEPAGTAALIEWGGIFLFAGASTRVQFRRRGIQRALSQRRLSDAVPGAIVQVVAMPGSESHRNAQRSGFQPIYSKIVLTRS